MRGAPEGRVGSDLAENLTPAGFSSGLAGGDLAGSADCEKFVFAGF